MDLENRVHKDRNLLLLAAVLSTLLAVTEVFGGHYSGSLSLLGDALHLFSDIASYLVGIVGLTVSLRPATPRLSFGFDRAESLAALTSVVFIWIMSGFLSKGAVSRFQNPQPIHSLPMLIVAAIGLLGNITLAILIQRSHHNPQIPLRNEDEEEGIHFFHGNHDSISPNLRAALIHAVGDCLQSGSVLLGAIILHFYPKWLWIDPFCTLFSASIILFGSLPLVSETVWVFMEASPFTESELARIKEALMLVEGVQAISELHVWSLGHFRSCLNAKVKFENESNVLELLEKCERELMRRHRSIQHMSLQPCR